MQNGHLPDPMDARDDSAERAEPSLFEQHKGKLALGVAATLGLMILYNWREKVLEEEDPEDYKRLKKFTAPFEPEDEREQEEFERRMLELERKRASGDSLTPPER